MSRIVNSFFLSLLFVAGTISAQQGNDTSISYIFIGHCYQNGTLGKKIDYRVEALNKSPYEGIWLGGDVCSEAMLNYSTIQYIDSTFNLGNPETHWSLGNHDARVGNWEWYSEFTNRKTFYAYTSNKITRIIMNTNIVPYNCELLDSQYNMIKNVCDTVSDSRYLILIMHHGIWSGVPDLPPAFVYAQSDLKYWNSNCYDVNSTFVNSIYPMLVNVENRGVDVICILGDMGAGPKKFDQESVDGIRFLGCGLDNNSPEDNVLIFHLNKISYDLTYEFHNLDSLLLNN
ncbi:MAG: metallophosphoesterase [Chlorobi bacterium]|nr:metallophosphoesterase [Chlorobiota bacterium]